MHVVTFDSRIELELTQEQALKMIADLSALVGKANQTGEAWVATAATVEKAGVSSPAPGRITLRVTK